MTWAEAMLDSDRVKKDASGKSRPFQKTLQALSSIFFFFFFFLLLFYFLKKKLSPFPPQGLYNE